MSWPSIGIVVPVYDEGPGVEQAIRAVADSAGRYEGRALVIAVDDGSSDESPAVLNRLSEELDAMEVEHHVQNAGYGQALRTGARRAQALGLDYVAFIDSDLTNPPDDVLRMAELAADGHDYIKASRFVPGGTMEAVPASRRLVSRAGNLVGQVLFGTTVRDVTNGFRMVRTDLFLGWPLQERAFAVIVEELDHALRAGVRPVELPSTLSARTSEQRATAFSYSPRLVLSYLRYPLRAALRRLRRR